MIKILKDAFKISSENIILATPLLVFLLLINIYLMVAKDAVKVLPSALLFFLTLLLMVSAFMSGWFYMIKSAIHNFKNKIPHKENETFKLMNEFPVGIADYIGSYIGLSIAFLILGDIVLVSIYYIGLNLIGSIGITPAQFISATEAPVAMQALLDSMTKTQLLKLNYWYFLIMFSLQIFSLVTMFWPDEILYSTKNPIKALFYAIKRIILKPQSILLFILISILNVVMMIMNYISMFNPISYFVMTLVYFYFIVYIFVLLFLYYEEKIKGNRNSISDSDRQE